MAGDKNHTKRKANEMRILASLTAKPQTVMELAAAMGMCPSGTARYLDRLHAAPRRAHVCGHKRPGRNGSPAKIWAAGDKPDVEYVPQDCPMPKTSAQERRDQVLKLLAEKPRTARELAPLMHLVYGTVSKRIRELRQPGNRQIRIAKWLHPREVDPDKTDGGDWAPVYAVGTRPDAPKPAKETTAQRSARLRKDKDYREAEKAERRARYQVQATIRRHAKAGPQWFAALPGAQSVKVARD